VQESFLGADHRYVDHKKHSAITAGPSHCAPLPRNPTDMITIRISGLRVIRVGADFVSSSFFLTARSHATRIPGISRATELRGTSKKNEELTTLALPRYTRNPLYLGIVDHVSGFASGAQWLGPARMALMFLVIYVR